MSKALPRTVRVTRVIDGDTVEVRVGGGLFRRARMERIRLYGIDAPESKQRGGPQSTRQLRRLIGSGKGVQLIAKDTDQYGRTVGLIYPHRSGPEESYNFRMVQAGHAHCYMLSAADRAAYQQAQNDAQEHRQGLWKQKDPTPPWEWRQADRARSGPVAALFRLLRYLFWIILITGIAAAALYLYPRFSG